MQTFSAAELASLADERGLILPRRVFNEVVAALDCGKHVMLTGAPGTGKTSLAFLTAELGHRALRNTGYSAVTASAEWTIGDTIGRYTTSPEGMVFHPGLVLDALTTGEWLVIDEMNRAEFDKSFGPLFTVLAGQPVTLSFRQVGHTYPISLVPPNAEAPRDTEPIEVPAWWRIIATMNQFDKATLFRMSYGLMRRFAFIEVPSPTDVEIAALVRGPGEAVAQLLALRDFVDFGAALFIDAARFVERRSHDDDTTESRALYEAFYACFLPQLDAVDSERLGHLVEVLDPLFDAEERRELRHALCQFCGESPQQPARRRAKDRARR